MKKYTLLIILITVALIAFGCGSEDPEANLRYLGMVDGHIEVQNGTLNLLIDLLNESDFGDDQWENITFQTLGLMYDNAETFLKIEDVPKSFNKYHQKMSQAMEHQKLFVVYMEESIKQLEPEFMTKGQEELKAANELIEEANTLLP